MLMTEDRNSIEIRDSNSPGIVNKARVISYNLNEEERPDGIKVRYKLRIATGKRGRELDAKQAAVIMEVLQWYSRQHPPQT
jgi:hypothetical protein